LGRSSNYGLISLSSRTVQTARHTLITKFPELRPVQVAVATAALDVGWEVFENPVIVAPAEDAMVTADVGAGDVSVADAVDELALKYVENVIMDEKGYVKPAVGVGGAR
jgi:hypothetical protein